MCLYSMQCIIRTNLNWEANSAFLYLLRISTLPPPFLTSRKPVGFWLLIKTYALHLIATDDDSVGCSTRLVLISSWIGVGSGDVVDVTCSSLERWLKSGQTQKPKPSYIVVDYLLRRLRVKSKSSVGEKDQHVILWKIKSMYSVWLIKN